MENIKPYSFKSVLKSIFSLKTARFLGNGLSRLFKWMKISYRAATWIFLILTLLLGWGLYGSVMSVIALEGLVIFPLIGGVIKLGLLTAVVIGWFQFWLVTKTLRKGVDIVDKAELAYDIGKRAMPYTKNTDKTQQDPKSTEQIPHETRTKQKASRSPGKKYFR